MPERQQWEYNTFVFSRDGKKSDIDGVLQVAGPEGWELAGIATMTKEVILVFKRPSGWG
jgi:hypothetical protein